MADGRSETIEVCALTELKTMILGKEEPGDWKDGEYVNNDRKLINNITG